MGTDTTDKSQQKGEEQRECIVSISSTLINNLEGTIGEINPRFSRDWEWENSNVNYTRGGQPYYLPLGFLTNDHYYEN